MFFLKQTRNQFTGAARTLVRPPARPDDSVAIVVHRSGHHTTLQHTCLVFDVRLERAERAAPRAVAERAVHVDAIDARARLRVGHPAAERNARCMRKTLVRRAAPCAHDVLRASAAANACTRENAGRAARSAKPVRVGPQRRRAAARRWLRRRRLTSHAGRCIGRSSKRSHSAHASASTSRASSASCDAARLSVRF